VPERVTTDGHYSHPRAIRLTLSRDVRHRTNVYLNNRLEQGHRGIKGRIQCMHGFKEHGAANCFAVSTMNFATLFAADPVTTTTFQPSAGAVDFSVTPALRCASCRPHDQQNSTNLPHRKWRET
jgi:transposase-like protein